MEEVIREGLGSPCAMEWLYLSVLKSYFSQPSFGDTFTGIDIRRMKEEIELAPNTELLF